MIDFWRFRCYARSGLTEEELLQITAWIPLLRYCSQSMHIRADYIIHTHAGPSMENPLVHAAFSLPSGPASVCLDQHPLLPVPYLDARVTVALV